MSERSAFALDVFERVLALNIGVTQRDNAEAFRLLSSVYPLALRRYRSGTEHNGWVIPHEWRVRKALITRGGQTLFDGTVHPMAVGGYSSPFTGTLSKQALDEHLFHSREYPNEFVFHCMFNYRPWQKHWAMCVPYNVWKTWGPGDYDVELDTEFVHEDMLVADAHLEGARRDTIVFNAHTCHPCQANDDLSGVFVILALFQWLASEPRHFSYRAVLAPEHLGTVFYIADLDQEDLARLELGCFVEMVGTRTPLVLQRSLTGTALIDRIAEHVLRQVDPALKVGDFRTIVGNDESVWEAPGIEVPMISISRYPYPEYHTSADNLSIISETHMREALDALKAMVTILETDRTIHRQFTGLLALSNPRYNLYKERPDPVVDKGLTETDRRLGELQDLLPRYYDGSLTVFELAERFGLSFDTLSRYLSGFADKGLVQLRPPVSLEHYAQIAPR